MGSNHETGKNFRAIKGLEKLIPNNSDIDGKKLFDIGCGSCLSMLAALRHGASEASGVDIDPRSVDAAQALLSQFALKKRWRVCQRSVFELNSEDTEISTSSIAGVFFITWEICGKRPLPRRELASYDVHDWLAGYPYESALPDEVSSILKGIGLVLERVLGNCAGGKGVFGIACDEFVARRK